jgi:hypothetical protein
MTSGLAMKHLQDIEQVFWSKTSRTRPSANRPLVPVYRVGEPFHQGRCTWPEGGQFTYSPGGHELTLFRSAIRDDVVNEVRQGQAELALIVELPLIVLTYRFGQTIPWDDVPYSWHLQPVTWRVIPSVEHSPEARALLWITLVGAEDGIIHAQRGVTLSPSFTHSLHDAIRAQALMAFDPKECTSAISKVFLNYPSPVARLALAEARTIGNE